MNHTSARVASHVGKRILQPLAAMPDFFSIPRSRSRFRHPDRPRMRSVRLDEIAFRRIARYCVSPDESELFAVFGPLRSRIAVDCRRNKTDALCGYFVDADETVVATIRPKGEFASVGRPLLLSVHTADRQLRGLLIRTQHRDPHAAIFHVPAAALTRHLR